MRVFLFLLLLLASLQDFNPAQAQTIQPVPFYSMLNWDTSPYKSFRFTYGNPGAENWINYRILYPEGYNPNSKDEKKYPLTIILHGAGESARMEWTNSTRTNTPYPEGDPRRDNNDHQLLYGGREHLQAVQKGRFPGFVLFPQNFYGTWIDGKGEPDSKMRPDLQTTLELLKHLIATHNVDPNRIYIQGISNGGVGAWYAAYQRPDLFAAVLPMSAHGYPAMASRLANKAIWVFQGEKDDNPLPRTTQKTVDAIENAGGRIRYTVYPETGHNTWNRAYNEPDFFEWMLAQNKQNAFVQNKKPVVEAGSEIITTMPKNFVDLSGQAVDEDGIIVSSSWNKISGPAAATIEQEGSLNTRVSGLREGNYVFRLTVTDDLGATASDEVSVTVEVNPLSVNPLPEEPEENFIAYPNPFRDFIHLRIISEKPQQWALTLFNAQGKILFQGTTARDSFDKHPLTLEMDKLGIQLEQGLYFIQVLNKENRSGKTFMMLKK